MDNIDSKPQQTGGLKLMTVFIAVLALHVLVIGGFTVYHLMSAGGNDADFALDKNHKMKADGTLVADTATPDAGADKTSAASTGTAIAATNTPATESAAPSAPAPSATPPASPAIVASVPAPVVSTPPPAAAPASPTVMPPLVITSSDLAKISAIAPGLAPPPEPAANAGSATSAPAADLAPVISSSSVPSGPVHMPAVSPKSAHSFASAPETSAPVASARKELYTVKITDSYKKIAHAHHISVAQLKEANHIKSDTLHSGQKLVIPSGRTLVAKSETALEQDSGNSATGESAASLSAGSSIGKSGHRHVYTVARGDTLKKIAKKFNVSATSIRDANNLSDSQLTIGRKLKIPAREARTGGTLAPAPTPSQVETQPTPVAEPAPMPPAEPASPSPSPAASPELANMTF